MARDVAVQEQRIVFFLTTVARLHRSAAAFRYRAGLVTVLEVKKRSLVEVCSTRGVGARYPGARDRDVGN